MPVKTPSRRSSGKATASKTKNKTVRQNKTAKKSKKSTKRSKSSGTNKEQRLKQIEKMWDTIFNMNDNTKLIQEDVEPVTPMKPEHGKKQAVIVLIHADWCGHCQRLKPEWKQMKESLNATERPKIIFEEIESAGLDAGLDRLSNTYDIKRDDITYNGYPTIGTIRNKRFDMYGGERTSANLLEWVRGLIANSK